MPQAVATSRMDFIALELIYQYRYDGVQSVGNDETQVGRPQAERPTPGSLCAGKPGQRGWNTLIFRALHRYSKVRRDTV